MSTKPNSYVGLLGVDQSVLLLKKGNDIEKSSVFEELEKYNEKSSYRPRLISSRYGIYNDFENSGAAIVTNAKEEIRKLILIVAWFCPLEIFQRIRGYYPLDNCFTESNSFLFWDRIIWLRFFDDCIRTGRISRSIWLWGRTGRRRDFRASNQERFSWNVDLGVVRWVRYKALFQLVFSFKSTWWTRLYTSSSLNFSRNGTGSCKILLFGIFFFLRILRQFFYSEGSFKQSTKYLQKVSLRWILRRWSLKPNYKT